MKVQNLIFFYQEAKKILFTINNRFIIWLHSNTDSKTLHLQMKYACEPNFKEYHQKDKIQHSHKHVIANL